MPMPVNRITIRTGDKLVVKVDVTLFKDDPDEPTIIVKTGSFSKEQTFRVSRDAIVEHYPVFKEGDSVFDEKGKLAVIVAINDNLAWLSYSDETNSISSMFNIRRASR